jgi:hypothetical protein
MNINEDYNISTEDVIESIKSIDEKLSIAKEGYNDATANKKAKWESIMNQLLEDRLSLMELRDTYCN